jgi:hypothetical protein
MQNHSSHRVFFLVFAAIILLSLGLLGLLTPAPQSGKIDFSSTSYAGLNETSEYALGEVDEKWQEVRKASLSFQLKMETPDPFRNARIQVPILAQVVSGGHDIENGSEVFQWLSDKIVDFLVTSNSLNDVEFEVSYALAETPCGTLPTLAKVSSEVFIRSKRLVLTGNLDSKKSKNIVVKFDSKKCNIETDSRSFYGKISDQRVGGEYTRAKNLNWPQTIFSSDRQFLSGLSIKLKNKSLLEFCLAPCDETTSPSKTKLEVLLTKKRKHNIDVSFVGSKNLLSVTVDEHTERFQTDVVPKVLKIVNPIIGANDESRVTDTVLDFKLAATSSQWSRRIVVSLVLMMGGILLFILICIRSFPKLECK